MTTLDPHAPTNTDRIALSNELYELAESFLLEAQQWTSTDAQQQCARSGRTTAEIARQLLSGRADYAKATAYAEAGRLILANVVACRRFFTSMLTPPSRGSLT
ncbi:hypothetical protein [Microbacterium sp. GCS4]|uniref:hypothetical protein n=1 Tax=Microbacterium sp. GCS4 TaxID=1692239 RepID=UPI0006816783|nr:hypothetical protein [Microbacterium sp. GCS4]KNY06858.1 hypothetical protein AKH00_00500 [Microbacterium sp. GCS4]